MKSLYHKRRGRVRRRQHRGQLLTRRARLVVYACLVFIVLVALPSNHALRYLYPVRYEETVRREAASSGIDPLLVAAVARVESHFDPNAVSSQGAIGIMQVMPATGAWVAERMRLPNWREEHLYNPHLNIKVGVWYLAYLVDKFDGKIVPAIAAYNGGFSNVQKWLASGTWDGTARKSTRIPFPETRRYVSRVLHAYEWYHRVYPEESRLTLSTVGRNYALAQALASAASEGFSALLSK